MRRTADAEKDAKERVLRGALNKGIKDRGGGIDTHESGSDHRYRGRAFEPEGADQGLGDDHGGDVHHIGLVGDVAEIDETSRPQQPQASTGDFQAGGAGRKGQHQRETGDHQELSQCRGCHCKAQNSGVCRRMLGSRADPQQDEIGPDA